jgi:adenine-specific DNA-methyltransferase
VLNYIARYDETIEPRGKTGTIDRNQSGFSSKSRIKEVFQELLEKIQDEYIVLSYNNEGLLTEDELRELLRKKGLVTLYKIKYNKFKAQKNVDGDHVYEYLWVVHTEEFGRPEEITVE